MTNYKAGDAIRCIDATGTGDHLQHGVVYTPEKVSRGGARIKGIWFHTKRFERVEEMYYVKDLDNGMWVSHLPEEGYRLMMSRDTVNPIRRSLEHIESEYGIDDTAAKPNLHKLMTEPPEWNTEENRVTKNASIQIGPEGLTIGTGLTSLRVPPTVEEIRRRWNVDYNYDMNMANEAPRDIRALLEQIDSLEAERADAVSEMERYQQEARDVAADGGKHIREKNEALATLSAIEEAFYEAFKPDFVAWDWRDDETIQTFANKFVHLLVAWKTKVKR